MIESIHMFHLGQLGMPILSFVGGRGYASGKNIDGILFVGKMESLHEFLDYFFIEN
jgi:hypothetical protein